MDGLLSGNGETILVIEDEEMLVEITTVALEFNGYTVISARDGISGIRHFELHKDRISVVICDLNMPLLDGNSALQAILALRPDVKVIIVSGSVESQKNIDLPSSTSALFLQKPYRTERLFSMLHSLLYQEPVLARK